MGMVKQYCLAIFTQNECKPCLDLKDHVASLPKDQQSVLEFYPFKTVRGDLSPWAAELGITMTPTLVVLHDDKGEGDDLTKPIEMIVGCKAIKAALPATISDYTYVKTAIDEIHPVPKTHEGQEKGCH